jgi:hypothetical protein
MPAGLNCLKWSANSSGYVCNADDLWFGKSHFMVEIPHFRKDMILGSRLLGSLQFWYVPWGA